MGAYNDIDGITNNVHSNNAYVPSTVLAIVSLTLVNVTIGYIVFPKRISH